MKEVDRFWDFHTHTFHNPLVFSYKILLPGFLPSFRKIKFQKPSFAKTSFEKISFCFEKDFYQNIVLNYLVLIYDHTLLAQRLRTLFCFYKLKEILLEKIWLQNIFKILFLVLSRSTDCSAAGRAELLCRSTGRSTDVHQSERALRKTDRSTGSKSSALCFSRSTGSVDRQRVFTLCWDQWSTVRSTAFPTVGNPTAAVDRPIDRQ